MKTSQLNDYRCITCGGRLMVRKTAVRHRNKGHQLQIKGEFSTIWEDWK